MDRRVVLLAISPRVPAGLLSLDAWALLSSGAPVCAAESAAHPILPWLAAAEVEVTQVPGSAADHAAALLNAAASFGTAVWLIDPAGDIALGRALAGAADHDVEGLSVETMPGAWDAPGSRLLDVVAVMDRLRSPGGCPWDAEQTHESLAKYLLEEAYEAFDAITQLDSADPEDGARNVRDELGDVLLQVAFHSRVAAERDPQDGGFTIDDVAAGLVDKLIRRHPHVFSDVEVADAGEVQANWEDIKRAEKPGGQQPLDDLVLSMPALSLARKASSKARRAGLDGPSLPDVALPTTEAELGALLWALVGVADDAGWDAEIALRSAVVRYRDSQRG